VASRILLISDIPSANTGYGVATYFMAKWLRRAGYEVAFVAFQHIGDPTYTKIGEEFLEVYEGATSLSIERSFKEWKPDLAIHIRDAFAHSSKWFSGAYSLMSLKYRPKVALWCPVQNNMLPQEYVDACKKECDLCVSFTDWGKDELLFQGVTYNHLESIPLGYAPEVYRGFKPDERLELKKKHGFPTDKPLIGSVGVNDQHRKGWPYLVEAWAILNRTRPANLYIHSTPEGAFLIPHFAAQFGMAKKVLMPVGYSKTWMKGWDVINEYYNCFDVYGNTSIEEGFNLPILENLAIGNPVVATDLPVHREVLGEAGVFALARKDYATAWSKGYATDPEDMALRLEGVLREPAGTGRPYPAEHLERFKWANVVERWRQVINKHQELGVTL